MTKIYQLERNNSPKPLQSFQIHKNFEYIEKCFLVKETLYFLNNREIISYSTITKEQKYLKEFSNPRNNYSACYFVGNIYILGENMEVFNETTAMLLI